MTDEDQNPVARAVSSALNSIYDQIAIDREASLREARELHFEVDTWEAYQRDAPFSVMDEIADRHIQRCKLTVSGLGAAAGLGGFITVIPDALQFVTCTLRMVTGIAAAYGFDPDPDAQGGRTKLLVLQAYANANMGNSARKGTEAVALSAATKLFRSAVTNARWLDLLLKLIGRLIGIRLTRQGILRAIPVFSSGMNAGFNWYFARQIARGARAEFKQFRDELRLGKHKGDPDFEGLGN